MLKNGFDPALLIRFENRFSPTLVYRLQFTYSYVRLRPFNHVRKKLICKCELHEIKFLGKFQAKLFLPSFEKRRSKTVFLTFIFLYKTEDIVSSGNLLIYCPNVEKKIFIRVGIDAKEKELVSCLCICIL